jgi:hypothetical protein
LLSPLSFFSWEVAKWLFLFINLSLTFIIGWLVIWKIPFAGVKLARWDEIFLFLLYFDFSATRIAIENGQTTLLVFLMMVLALLYVMRSWQAAGLALGIALSKYSLSIAAFLFFLYKKNFKILFLAVAVQIVGLLGLTAISGNSPVKITQENFQVFREIFDQPGIHLSHFFTLFTDNRLLIQIPVLLMTLLVLIPLFLWSRQSSSTSSTAENIFDFHFVTILFIWAMLVAYHRLYDTVILIFFYVLIFKGLAYPNVWNLEKRNKIILLTFMALTPLILVIPARLVDKALSHYYGTIADAVTTVLLLVMLTLSMVLLRRYIQITKTESSPANRIP